MDGWWLETQKFPIWQHTASLYAIPVVLFMGLSNVDVVKPLAGVIAAYGIPSTLHAAVLFTRRGMMDQKMMFLLCASVVAHVIVYLPFVGRHPNKMLSFLVSGLILMGILSVYYRERIWPYSLFSPLTACCLSFCILCVNVL